MKARGRAGRKNIAVAIQTGESDKAYTGEFFYAPMVELGHRVGHRRLGNSRAVVRGNSFMRDAFDRSEGKATEKVVSVLSKAIAHVWKTGGKLTGFKVGD